MTWDGTEHRKGFRMELELRDKIIETHTDVRHIVDWAKAHDQSDNLKFEQANKRIGWIEKVAYMGIGGLALLNIVIRFVK